VRVVVAWWAAIWLCAALEAIAAYVLIW